MLWTEVVTSNGGLAILPSPVAQDRAMEDAIVEKDQKVCHAGMRGKGTRPLFRNR